MRFLVNWVEDRTGVSGLVKEVLFENIPGGARWRYVWGSTLTFAITIQFITGIFLWMAYSPSSQTAWESVYYIQEEMNGGWLLRGVHHYTAQLMVILLVLHLMQVVIDKAYKAPREVNFWFGVFLLLIVLGISLTGYLLPWDQKGYWATRVATNISANVPLIGPYLQRLIVGGSDYGHHTLTRFFALHAGVLPGALVALIVGHIYLFRKHGITPKKPLRKKDAYFWPDQVLKDAVACLAVLGAVLGIVLISGGAELGAPANPAEQYAAARPDWYFMFLFEFLKYFDADSQIWGELIWPGIVLGLVMLMPFFGNWKLGHVFSIFFLGACILGFLILTVTAYIKDRSDEDYQIAVALADRDAERVKELVRLRGGIPPEGALWLLRNDPVTQGPKLFAANCASCHTYGGHDGLGEETEEVSAADLQGFASREWIRGLLDPEKIETPAYFGATAFANPPEGEKKSKMIEFVHEELSEASDDELNKIAAALSFEALLPGQAAMDAADTEMIEEGRLLIGEEGYSCTDCHKYGDEGRKSPDLTGYGSKEWLVDFISDPEHKRFYGERNDRMPAFGRNGTLTADQISLLSDWLRGEAAPIGGAGTAGP